MKKISKKQFKSDYERKGSYAYEENGNGYGTLIRKDVYESRLAPNSNWIRGMAVGFGIFACTLGGLYKVHVSLPAQHMSSAARGLFTDLSDILNSTVDPTSTNHKSKDLAKKTTPTEASNSKAKSLEYTLRSEPYRQKTDAEKDARSEITILRIANIRKVVEEECAKFNSGGHKYFKGYKVDPTLFDAVVQVESNYNPDLVHYKLIAVKNPEIVKYEDELSRYKIAVRYARRHKQNLPKGCVKPPRPNVPARVHVPYLDKSNNKVITAYGLSGLTPATAEHMGIPLTKISDPQENIRGGVRKLGYLLACFKGDKHLALAAYNAGENRIIKSGYNIPKILQTQDYVEKVIRRLSSEPSS